MLAQAFDSACRVSPGIRRFLIRNWFQWLSTLDKEALMIFMNLGYASLDSSQAEVVLDRCDEVNRYGIQMYHHVAGAVDLAGLNVLEVGSGRGGGASYIMRYLKPASMTGVDISEKAIKFCSRHHCIEGLRFLRGDAESLPFENNTFDAVVNVESSYGYGHIDCFLSEVFRVLRPKGYFLYTDYRDRNEMDMLRKHLLNSSLVILKEERINVNVLKALDLDNERKLRLIDQKVPGVLRNVFHYFAAMQGSEMYEALRAEVVDYRSFVLYKEKG